MRDLPAIEYLRERLDYDPESGVLIWKSKKLPEGDAHQTKVWNSKYAGSMAGTVKLGNHQHHRYIHVNLEGQRLYAHRIAWALMKGTWPSEEIDHINRNGLDNRWINLRQVTSSENGRNMSQRSDSKTKVTGVSFDTSRDMWVASGRAIDCPTLQKRFNTFEEAVVARKLWEHANGFSEHHGEVNPHLADDPRTSSANSSGTR